MEFEYIQKRFHTLRLNFKYLHENGMLCQCWHMHLIKYNFYFTMKIFKKLSRYTTYFIIFLKFFYHLKNYKILVLRDVSIGYITLEENITLLHQTNVHKKIMLLRHETYQEVLDHHSTCSLISIFVNTLKSHIIFYRTSRKLQIKVVTKS